MQQIGTIFGRDFRSLNYIKIIIFTGSPGTPSSSPPSSVAGAPPHLHHRSNNCGGNGGGLHPGVKLPDENSNMATTALPANSALVDRHESISPASMDSSIHDSADERGAKSKTKKMWDKFPTPYCEPSTLRLHSGLICVTEIPFNKRDSKSSSLLKTC